MPLIPETNTPISKTTRTVDVSPLGTSTARKTIFYRGRWSSVEASLLLPLSFSNHPLRPRGRSDLSRIYIVVIAGRQPMAVLDQSLD